jgi:hypothetical protein
MKVTFMIVLSDNVAYWLSKKTCQDQSIKLNKKVNYLMNVGK